MMVRGAEVFASTGGRDFGSLAGQDGSAPVLCFLHGSGQSHLSWILQGRFFANRGWRVLAPDFPAHGHSGGAALDDIGDMADWCLEVLDALGVETVVVIGHSQGCLVGLEMAARADGRVVRLALIAGALTIAINPALLEMAQTREAAAIAAMMGWGFGAAGHWHRNTVPGMSHMGFGTQVMAANESGALAADLQACHRYQGGAAAAARIACPALCILSRHDRMTPVRRGRDMAAALADCRTVEVENAGHMLPVESPFAVNRALRAFVES